jgi:hypothetical protein
MSEVHYQILEDRSTADGQRMTLLARRWAAAFRSPFISPRPDAAPRLAHALAGHVRHLGKTLGSVRILTREELAAWLEDHRGTHNAWKQHLEHKAESLREMVLRTQLHEIHPILIASGNAVLIRAEELPLSHRDVLRRLHGNTPSQIAGPIAQSQLDTLLTICGWSLAAAGSAAPELGAAFETLLPVYEEGLIPLGCNENGVFHLWLP